MDIEEEFEVSEDGGSDGRADSAAIDLVKQLITLAAGVLALSATFLEKIGDLSRLWLSLLAASWLFLILSVFGGIQTLSVIVKSRLSGNNDWSEGPGKRYAQISKYGFLVGISLFAIFALVLLAAPKKKDRQPNSSAVTNGNFLDGRLP